jgi:hypothetical protein
MSCSADQRDEKQQLEAPHQRQRRAIYSYPLKGMGLRDAIPELRGTQPATCRSITG